MILHFLNENVGNSGQAHLNQFEAARIRTEKNTFKIKNLIVFLVILNNLFTIISKRLMISNISYEKFQIKFMIHCL